MPPNHVSVTLILKSIPSFYPLFFTQPWLSISYSNWLCALPTRLLFHPLFFHSLSPENTLHRAAPQKCITNISHLSLLHSQIFHGPHHLQYDTRLAPHHGLQSLHCSNGFHWPVAKIHQVVLTSRAVTHAASPCWQHPSSYLYLADSNSLIAQLGNNHNDIFHNLSPFSHHFPPLNQLCTSSVTLSFHLSHCITALQGECEIWDLRVHVLFFSWNFASCLTSGTQTFWWTDFHQFELHQYILYLSIWLILILHLLYDTIRGRETY